MLRCSALFVMLHAFTGAKYACEVSLYMWYRVGYCVTTTKSAEDSKRDRRRGRTGRSCCGRRG